MLWLFHVFMRNLKHFAENTVFSQVFAKSKSKVSSSADSVFCNSENAIEMKLCNLLDMRYKAIDSRQNWEYMSPFADISIFARGHFRKFVKMIEIDL